MKHVGRDPREKLQKLSCHRLPGVDIRPGEKKNTEKNISHFIPGLVIENIPGLSFEGYDRKPNRRIAVEHVFSSGEEPALDDDLCPTESTTSRFEKMEKMVKESEEKETPHIERYVTKEQLLVIERDLIKKRLPQILKDFNDVSARVSRSESSLREDSQQTNSRSEKPNIPKKQNLDNLKKTSSEKGKGLSPTPEVSDKDEAKTSEEKYTTSFESITEKECSDVDSSRTRMSPAKTLSHVSEQFSDENATMCSEGELSPDPSVRQKEECEQGEDKEEAGEPQIEQKEDGREGEEDCEVRSEEEGLSQDSQPIKAPSAHIYPQLLSTIDEVTSVAISGPSSITTDQPEVSLDQDQPEGSKSEKLTPDVEEIDFEAPSRGELTPDVDEIDFEEVSSEQPSQENPSSMKEDVQLSEFGNRSIYQSDFEDASQISEGGPTAGAALDSSISSDNNMKEAAREAKNVEEDAAAEPSSSHSPVNSPDVPQPQPPPSPFQRQFEHFVVSQSFSIEGEEGEKTEDDELGEGRLSEEEKKEKDYEKAKVSEALAQDLNLSSGRLTPDVEEINFENLSDSLVENENQTGSLFKEKLAKEGFEDKEIIKEMCDEITLDVVDSIVTEAQEAERGPELQRQVSIGNQSTTIVILDNLLLELGFYGDLPLQDTEASFCESEALSSEMRLSEGEVLLPKVNLLFTLS